MPMYLYRGRYTPDGVRGVIAEGGAERAAATSALFASLGGTVHHYGLLFGSHDFVILAELPDDATAVVPPMLARSTGTVDVTVERILAVEELDGVADTARAATFRAAGA